MSDLVKGLEKIEKQIDEDMEKSIKEMILGIRTSFDVPSNMSDDDLRSFLEPYFKDDMIDKLGNTPEEFTMNLIIYLLKDLQEHGIKIKLGN